MDSEENERFVKAEERYNTRLLELINKRKESKELSADERLLLSNYLTVLPKYMPGREYHLRVDYPEDSKKIETFMVEHLETNVVFAYAYHEGGDDGEDSKKSHYHMHIVYNVLPTRKELNKYRMDYKRYFGRSGSSFSLACDKGVSRIYVTKEKKRVDFTGVLSNFDEVLKIYEILSSSKEDCDAEREQLKKKREEKKASGKTPMEILYESYNERMCGLCDAYNKSHLDKRDISFYQTEKYMCDYVMEHYANILKKSFSVQRMAEALLYLRYRIKGYSVENPDRELRERILRKAFDY